MSKLVRFNEDYFGYLVDHDFTSEEAWRIDRMFQNAWPGKRLIIMQADEFVDLTGQYEIVPIPESVPA